MKVINVVPNTIVLFMLIFLCVNQQTHQRATKCETRLHCPRCNWFTTRHPAWTRREQLLPQRDSQELKPDRRGHPRTCRCRCKQITSRNCHDTRTTSCNWSNRFNTHLFAWHWASALHRWRDSAIGTTWSRRHSESQPTSGVWWLRKPSAFFSTF